MIDTPIPAGILLDTNFVSELMSQEPNPIVTAWWESQGPDTLFIPAIAVAEIRTGIAILPAGRRKRRLEAQADGIVQGDFVERILPFGLAAALHYGDIVAARGRPINPRDMADCMIAAIARSTGMAVATRNVRDFVGIGVDVIEPWAAA